MDQRTLVSRLGLIMVSIARDLTADKKGVKSFFHKMLIIQFKQITKIKQVLDRAILFTYHSTRYDNLTLKNQLLISFRDFK